MIIETMDLTMLINFDRVTNMGVDGAKLYASMGFIPTDQGPIEFIITLGLYKSHEAAVAAYELLVREIKWALKNDSNTIVTVAPEKMAEEYEHDCLRKESEA